MSGYWNSRRASSTSSLSDSNDIGLDPSTLIGDGLTPSWLAHNPPAGTATNTEFASNIVLDVTVAVDAVAEIDGASGQSVTFEGTTGTLKLDDSVAFTGQISGLAGSDALDLADVSYGSNTTASFLGNAVGGTLTVSDGPHTANFALTGNYLSSSWTLSSDGHGGTIVVDPVASTNWQTLDVGAGGWLTGIDVAPDGTMVVRTDTYGAYIWNGTAWQQLVTSASMPAGFVTPDSNSQGVYEIQIAPSNSNIMYMMYEGYVFKSTNKGGTWTETSFSPVSENTSDSYRMDGQKMAIDPSNPNIVYVGTAKSGLFVSMDGGASWQGVSSVPVSLTDSGGNYPGITGIEFDSALGVTGGQTNTIFAASYGNGVYESTNAGASWSAIGGPSNVEYAAVSNTGIYYAIGNGSALWSYKSGTWTELLANTSGQALETVAVNPANPSEIVVQTAGGVIDVSYNGGATWSGFDSNRQLSATDIPWLASTGTWMTVGGTVFNPLAPNELITSAGVGVWTTTLPTSGFVSSSTVTWTSQSAGIEQLVANEIIVPPGGDPVLASWDRPFFYISNANAYPSTYGPNTGNSLAEGWSIDYASSTPSFLVGIADNWGLEQSGYSTNGGQTWTAFSSFIPGAGTNFIGGTIAASSPTDIIWAPADGHQPYYTLNGGQSWNPINLPGVTNWNGFDFSSALDARTVTADRVLPNTFYLYYAGDWAGAPAYGLYKTTDGGVTWTQVYNGEITPYSMFNAELQAVPGQAGNLFFTGGPQDGYPNEPFMHSTNGGSTWTAVANVTEVNCFGFGAPAPGQNYPSIYIVGYVNSVYGVWQSNDDAHSWVQIGTYPTGDLDQIKTISGDPNTYGQVYVGFAGSGYAYLPAAGTTATTAPPSAPIIAAFSPDSSIVGDGITNATTLTLTGTAAANSTVTVFDGTTQLGTATVNASGAWSFNTGTLANGTHSFTSTDTDASANTSAASTALTVTVNTVAPVVSSLIASGSGITSGSGDLNAGHTVTLTMTLSEAVTVAGGTPTLTLNDGGTATYTGGSGSNALTFRYTVAAGQNTANLAVTAVNLNAATVADVAGNAAVSINAILAGTLQIDTAAPAAPMISSDSPATGTAVNAVTLTGTAEANSVVTVYEGTSILGTVTATSAGAWSYTTGTLAAGSYAFTATATDAAGNVSAMSQPIDPTIGSNVYPTNNTTLTITDTNDTVVLSGSNDTVNLTGGSNTIQLSGSNDSLTITGNGNSISVTGSNDSVSATGVDTVTFSGSGTVVATIGSGSTLNLADSLTGSGNDILALSGSNGTVNLNQFAHFSGFSEISLSGSNDRLTLTNANLTVTRLSGSGDTIALGTGSDTVAYTNVNQSTHSSPDSIIGWFNTSQDKIDFSAINGLNSSAQNVTINFLTSAPNNIAGHTIDVVISRGSTIVYANATGSNESINAHHEDMQINLIGVAAPNSSDFILHH